jgi:hypothetical protein
MSNQIIMELLDNNTLQWVLTIGNIFFMISVVILLTYTVMSQGTNSRTSKYKIVAENEGPFLRGATNMFSVSVTFYTFVLVELSLGLIGTSGYIFAGLIALITGYSFRHFLIRYVKYYHPFILEKKLKDIRFKPMKSAVTGKPMVLLNEKEEDIHLTSEMIEEEDSLPVDYDVWIDEESDYKVIERYNTRFHPLVCDHCHFRTLDEKKAEVVKEPTEHEKGLLRRYYECSYCNHIETRDKELPTKGEERTLATYDKDIVEAH